MKRAALIALCAAACGAEPTVPRTIHIEGPGRVWSPDARFDCDAARCTTVAAPDLRVYAAPEANLVAWETCGDSIGCDVDGDTTVTFAAPTCAIDEDATTGVLLYGQSLAIGTQGTPALTTAPPFPGDARVLNAAGTLLCDAVEGRACGWPDVESPRTAIVETWRRLRGRGRFVMTSHGRGSTAIADLSEGSEAYATLLARVEATRALVDGAYVVAAVAFVHGPADEGRTGYTDALIRLADDLDRDLRAITGQDERVHLFVDQTSAWTRGPTAEDPNVALEQLAACVEHSRIHCVAPQYDLDFGEDRLHLVAASYREVGARFGRAMHARLDRCARADAPFVETAWQIDGAIEARYATSDAIALDTARCPKQPAFGFELVGDDEPRTIRRVTVASGDRLRIESAADECGLELRYAFSGEARGGAGCREDGARAPAGNVHAIASALTQSIRVLCAD